MLAYAEISIKRDSDPEHAATHMKLLTKALRRQLPALYSQEDKGMEAVAYCKFFTPDAQWTWYATEFDGQDTFYGYVIGICPEFGYFCLSQLRQVRGGLGLPVERDRFFEPTPLSELVKEQEQ